MSEPQISSPVIIDVGSLTVDNPNSIQPVYCNNANAAIAPWDIRLIFTEIVTTSKPAEVFNILRASVAMNPGHAKALLGSLAGIIDAYEKNYGEIKMPAPPSTEKLK